MTAPPPAPAVRPRRSPLTTGLAAAAVLVPVGIAIGLPYVPPAGPVPVFAADNSLFPPAGLPFDRVAIGPAPGFRPQIGNVKIVDLDSDGRPDVLACDVRRHRVFWYRQTTAGGWEERPVGPELNSPAVATPVDLDGDGDLDVVVGLLGFSVVPTDERTGKVVLLENRGDGTFAARTLLDDVRRVSDVQAGDLDGDGDIDLVVASFGYRRGEILWLENRGGGKFRDHRLLATDGPSHVPLADFDGDGDLDVAALVSQDHEEVWLFANDGKGQFTPSVIHAETNFDLGGAGLIAADLDRDGDPDLILSAGDNQEINANFPQPWHGVYWLENKGGLAFEWKPVGRAGGVYAAAVADFDGDRDNDVVAACIFNDWRTPGAASLVLFENDGRQNFTGKMLATAPAALATVAAGDLNRDGRPDVVGGSIFLADPPTGLDGRLTLWLSRAGGGR